MTKEDFYKLNSDDMYDCLRMLRIKYELFYISVVDLKHLTNLIQSGYNITSLKAYLFTMNENKKREIIAIKYDDTESELFNEFTEWYLDKKGRK